MTTLPIDPTDPYARRTLAVHVITAAIEAARNRLDAIERNGGTLTAPRDVITAHAVHYALADYEGQHPDVWRPADNAPEWIRAAESAAETIGAQITNVTGEYTRWPESDPNWIGQE